MKWLTKDEIDIAANESDIEAAKNSIHHWNQIKRATKEELKEGFTERVDIKLEWCAICIRYHQQPEMGLCPLYDGRPMPGTFLEKLTPAVDKATGNEFCDGVCCLEWYQAHSAVNAYFAGKINQTRMRLFVDKLIDKLKTILEQFEKEI